MFQQPKTIDIKVCPVCHAKVDVAYQGDADEPFTSYSPFMGIVLWGPYDAEKQVICQQGKVVHFKLGTEERLVILQ